MQKPRRSTLRLPRRQGDRHRAIRFLAKDLADGLSMYAGSAEISRSNRRGSYSHIVIVCVQNVGVLGLLTLRSTRRVRVLVALWSCCEAEATHFEIRRTCNYVIIKFKRYKLENF